MSYEMIISKVRDLFQSENNRKRRSSHLIEGPPQKLIKNTKEHRFIRDEPLGMRKSSIFASMGSILSKFKSTSNACEPIELEEYSDDEDVTFVATYKKHNFATAPTQVNNIQSHKMERVSSRSSSTTRPVPDLIERNKFSRIPDLQKYIKPQLINVTRTPRVNGFQYETANYNTHKGGLVNGGSSSSFKPPNSNCITNNLSLSRNVSNYFKSTNSFEPPHKTSNSLAYKQNHAADMLEYEQLLESVHNNEKYTAQPLLPTLLKPLTARNNVTNSRSRRSSVIHILDDDINQTDQIIRRFSVSSSIHGERQVTPVNTMRMKNEATSVFQNSFPDIFNEKCSITKRERQEKISQLEEKSKELSKSRLNQSHSFESRIPNWRKPDFIVFDEDIEEKVDDFPEFTDSQKSTILHAMSGHPHNVLVTKFNITISRDHIRTLQWDPLAWLNDEVINFYMNLLTERGEIRSNDGYPKVYAMNTFFTQRLCSGGYSAVRRWTKKVDIFSCDIIPVPVHVGNVHWCMAIINMKQKTIKYYDSMGSPNHRILSALEQYLREESLDKRKLEFDLSGWSTENVTDNPRQQNGSDCGVFSCMTAEFICRNRPIVFNQQHMNYFRQKMVLEICTGKMLL